MLGKRKVRPKRVKVKEATASRAVFVAGDDELHRIALTFTGTDGNRYEAEIPLVEAGKLISQLKASYNAALPKHYREIQ